MPSRVVFCKKCKSTYSTDIYPIAECPECNTLLVETNMLVEEWQSKSADEKNQLKTNWSSDDFKPDESPKTADAASVEHSMSDSYLEQIAKATRRTANWVTFWSIILLVGIAATAVWFIMELL